MTRSSLRVRSGLARENSDAARRMSGTGAAFFAAFSTLRAATDALAHASGAGARAWICRPVPAWQ